MSQSPNPPPPEEPYPSGGAKPPSRPSRATDASRPTRASERGEPMTFGMILQNGFHIFAKNFVPLFIVYFGFGLIYVALDSFLLVHLEYVGSQLAAEQTQILDQLLDSIAGAAGTGTTGTTTIDEAQLTEAMNRITAIYGQLILVQFVLRYMQEIFQNLALVFGIVIAYNYYQRNTKSLGENVQEITTANLPHAIGLTLVMSALTSIGLELFILPALLVIGFLLLSYPYCAVKKATVGESLKGGFQLSKGNFLKTVGLAIVVYIIRLIFESLIGLAVDFAFRGAGGFQTWYYDPATRNYGLIFLYNLVAVLVTSLILPIYATAYTCLYIDAQARKRRGPRPSPMGRYGGGYGRPYGAPQRDRYGRPMPEAPPTAWRDQYIKSPATPPDGRLSQRATPTPGAPRPPPAEEEEDAGDVLFCPYCGQPVRGTKCGNCGQDLPFKKKP